MNEDELVAAYGGSGIIVEPPRPSSLPVYRRCLGVGPCDTLIPEPRRYCLFCLGTMAGIGEPPERFELPRRGPVFDDGAVPMGVASSLAGMGRAPASPGPVERREGG